MRMILLAAVLAAPPALAQSAPRPFPDTRGADPDIICLLATSKAPDKADDEQKRSSLDAQLGFFASRVDAHFPSDAALVDAFRKTVAAYGDRPADIPAFLPACAQRFVPVTNRMSAGMAAASRPAR